MVFTRNYKEDVTIWIATQGFAGFTFSAPIVVKGRWEQKAIMFRTPEGNEEASEATVYIRDQDVSVGDWIFLGISAASDPTQLPTARRVRQFHKTPDLRNLEHERKAFV